jgi:uncharacterized protein (DUF2147 family)
MEWNIMKFVVAATITVLLAACLAHAQPAEPSGTYISETGDTRVRIAKCGAAYCGTIVGVKGDAKDSNNPDPAKRSRSLVGVQMISDIRPSADGWTGSLYNPKDGKTYSGKMKLNGTSLELSGCVLGGLICRSQTWARAG